MSATVFNKPLSDELTKKADLNSPALTGTPTAPTAAAGTNTTQIATTAFVQSKLDKPAQAGTLDQILRSDGNGNTVWTNAATQTEIGTAVTNWLDANVPTGTTVVVDNSLSIQNAAAEAKTTGDAIALEIANRTAADNDLKSALDYTAKNVIQVPTGKNLYSGMNEQDGYLVNGVVTPNSSWKTSDYIDVTGLTAVVCSSARNNVQYPRGTLALYYLTTYNSNGEYIETKSSYSSNTYTIESGVKYIRFCHGVTGYVDDIMVEIGTSYSSAFEPYTYKTVLKNSPYVENADYQQTVSSLNEVSSDVDEIEKKINGNFEPFSYDYLTFTETADRYIKKNGQVATVSGNNYYGSDYVSVDEYGTYYITAWANYEHALYAFYDSNNSLVSVGMLSANTSTGTEITDYEVTVPQGASKLVIAYAGTGTGKIGEAETYKVKGSYPWAGKTWVCMGDSLTEVNSRTTLHYHDYIAQKTGITVNNMGKSGTGYAKTYQKSAGVTYENFMDRALTIPATCDVMTIFGSGNDNSTELPIGVYTDADHTSGTLAGYVNETIDNIYSVNPIINLGIVSPTPWENQNPMNENCWMYKYSAMLKSICEHRSIPFLDLYHCSNLRPWDATFRTLAYSKDDGGGTHPDETGHLLIAPRFEAFLDSLLLR